MIANYSLFLGALLCGSSARCQFDCGFMYHKAQKLSFHSCYQNSSHRWYWNICERNMIFFYYFINCYADQYWMSNRIFWQCQLVCVYGVRHQNWQHNILATNLMAYSQKSLCQQKKNANAKKNSGISSATFYEL